MTLPQPCWSVTGATEWIMSQCHQTESPGCTSGIGVTRLHQQRVPALVDREGLVERDPAHAVRRHVVQQRAQHQVGHGQRDRHRVQHALVVAHLGQRRPALEGAERRAHGRARVLGGLGAVGGVPRVVGRDVAVEQVPEVPLVALGHPQVEAARVQVRAEPAGRRARRAAADPVRVHRVAVRVEPARGPPTSRVQGGSGTTAPRPSAGAGGPASGPVTSRSGRSPAWTSRCRRSRRPGRGSSRRTGWAPRSRRPSGPRPRPAPAGSARGSPRSPAGCSLATSSGATVPASMSA